MNDSSKSSWAKILFGGIGVAIFGFIANTSWQLYSHRDVSPEYVVTSMRFEDDQMMIFVRNNSDEPLDLIAARIELNTTHLQDLQLGAYPKVSKIYEVSSTARGATLDNAEGKLVVELKIIQAIEPREADEFSFKIEGPFGPIDLSDVQARAELQDSKRNTYLVTY